tara:strand:+ start:95 stop:604 length:510 start_codon:yes stop_codon:yes gene_type:complete
METIAEFNDDAGLNVKLTSEKIFISALGAEETFALRGVTGIGLYDDLKKYNEELEVYKKGNKNYEFFTKNGKYIAFGLAGILLFGAFNTLVNKGEIGPLPGGVIFSLIGVYWDKVISFLPKLEKPKVDSYFRLMISGGQREFPFDKSDDNSVKIADFINKVEDTLTAYK